MWNMYLQVMQRISTKSRAYLNNRNKGHSKSQSIFIYCMLELERNAHCVAFQKNLEKGYHWNDPTRHVLIVYL